MIDFRYHLVSLVSVFLALAVGIVLGAGPLKEPISEGLSQSVQSLRQDRDALGEQLKTAQAAARNRDAFVADVQGRLVANLLGGRGVVLLTLPGADTDAVRPLTQALTSAGATVTGRVDLKEAWVDPAARAARDAAISALRSSASLPDPQPDATPTAMSAPRATTQTPEMIRPAMASRRPPCPLRLMRDSATNPKITDSRTPAKIDRTNEAMAKPSVPGFGPPW